MVTKNSSMFAPGIWVTARQSSNGEISGERIFSRPRYPSRNRITDTKHEDEKHTPRVLFYGMEVAEIIGLTITYHHIGMIFALNTRKVISEGRRASFSHTKDYLTIVPASSMEKGE
jgi:hypothetical protein